MNFVGVVFRHMETLRYQSSKRVALDFGHLDFWRFCTNASCVYVRTLQKRAISWAF